MLLTQRVLATIRRHALIPAGTSVLAAVSGGADSVALALILARLSEGGRFTLAGLAHLNHGLRGQAAADDEAFVEALAARLNVRFVAAREDVAARARERHESIEAAARRARYVFLDAAATELGAARIATGHTADDQAETLLLRLMRGAGLDGLSGVRARNGIVIRPLLESRRVEIETFLRAAGQPWREDASNADRAIPRNRIRHDVMPVLVEAGGTAVVDALARTAALIGEDAQELERQAIEIATGAVSSTGDATTVDIARLEAAGPALAQRVLRAAMQEVAGGRFFSLEHVLAVRSLISEDSQAVQVPGVMATRRGQSLRLERWPALAGSGLPSVSLPVPGAAEVAAGVTVWAEVVPGGVADVGLLRCRGDMVAVQGIEAPTLTVRSRRPGDAFRPLGAPGRRKLQDVFVDRKISRAERDRVPLVVDDQGRIIWVVGHTIADEFRVTAPSARVLLLKVSRQGIAKG